MSAHIDEATGLDVTVDTRSKRDVQDDHVSGDDAQTVRDALSVLWEAFCADTAAWPVRS